MFLRDVAVWPISEQGVQALLASVSPGFARILPENLALEFGALACAQEGKSLTVAISQDPSDAAITRIERATGLQVEMHVVAPDLLAPEIARCYGTVDVRKTTLVDEREEQSLAEYIDQLFERAILERASDIHVDTLRESTRIRFRIDGHLRFIHAIDAHTAARLTSRLKLLAGLDISERRLPQDGRLSFSFKSRAIDVRVASVPSESGERLALRILDREGADMRLEQLVFSPETLLALQQILQCNGGFFVVCGPTGSGKSTTLYALLRELHSDERHLCTVEDPVEKIIPGITQVPIHVKSGLTFAHALRALLRQDPDVVMIGEIRDQETATTALGAALSGQLVLTTVHGSDIARGIDRLCELGLSRTMLLQAMTGIMTQRLVRRLCSFCRVAAIVGPADIAQYGFAPNTQIYQAKGCDRCNETGYRGRIVLTDIVLLHPAYSTEQRTACLQNHTLYALLEDARRRCINGDTTIAEIASLFLTIPRPA